MSKEYETQEMKDKYQERLKKIIAKKFDTTMIFPLSQFEAAFGHLWGHALGDDAKLTDEQKMLRAKWTECRNSILNLGNAQKRNAMKEIGQYDVVWNRYNAVFIPMDKYKEMFDRHE